MNIPIRKDKEHVKEVKWNRPKACKNMFVITSYQNYANEN